VVDVRDDGDIANLWHGILAFSSIVGSASGCGLYLKPAGNKVRALLEARRNKRWKQKWLQVRPCSPHAQFQEELQVPSTP
jgi:hypothetical protein